MAPEQRSLATAGGATAAIAACSAGSVIAVPMLLVPAVVEQPPCVWMPSTWSVAPCSTTLPELPPQVSKS
jgi:hypothetical protein